VRGYLLDTSVLSILAPDRPALPPAFASWLRNQTDRLFLPAIAVAEVEAGICKLRRQGASARADRLSTWLDAVLAGYGNRILPLDTAAARTAGRLSDAVLAKGRSPGFADVAIAAIAVTHDLVVLTRNLRHFAALDVSHADPLDTLPS
jgi:predicted nucleic acid-binding protein